MTITHRITRPASVGVVALFCAGSLALAPAALADPGTAQPQGPATPAPALGSPSSGSAAPANPHAAGQAGATPGHHDATGPHATGPHDAGPHDAGTPVAGTPAAAGRPGHGTGRPAPSAGHRGEGSPQQAGAGRPVTGTEHGSGDGRTSSSVSDPAGNNGTVKIAPLGNVGGIPDNTPHVGCSFLVEWYGFDQGEHIVSTVSFTEQAPTTGVGLTVDGPSQVLVGGDPATGAGTETGLDGREQYTLSFTGAPHPKQGFHVRLTIHTPGSIGNDSKTKVFWVQGCPATATTLAGTTAAGTTTAGTRPGNTPVTAPSAGSESFSAGAGADDQAGSAPVAASYEHAGEVLALQSVGAVVASSADDHGPALPTAVDAGVAGSLTGGLPQPGTALLGTFLVLLGVLTGRLGWARVRG